MRRTWSPLCRRSMFASSDSRVAGTACIAMPQTGILRFCVNSSRPEERPRPSESVPWPLPRYRMNRTHYAGATVTMASIECDDDIADKFAVLDRFMSVGDAIKRKAGGDAVLKARIGQQHSARRDRSSAD